MLPVVKCALQRELQLYLFLCINVFLASSLWPPLLLKSAHAELAHFTEDCQGKTTILEGVR